MESSLDLDQLAVDCISTKSLLNLYIGLTTQCVHNMCVRYIERLCQVQQWWASVWGHLILSWPTQLYEISFSCSLVVCNFICTFE